MIVITISSLTTVRCSLCQCKNKQIPRNIQYMVHDNMESYSNNFSPTFYGPAAQQGKAFNALLLKDWTEIRIVLLPTNSSELLVEARNSRYWPILTKAIRFSWKGRPAIHFLIHTCMYMHALFWVYACILLHKWMRFFGIGCVRASAVQADTLISLCNIHGNNPFRQTYQL